MVSLLHEHNRLEPRDGRVFRQSSTNIIGIRTGSAGSMSELDGSIRQPDEFCVCRGGLKLGMVKFEQRIWIAEIKRK